MRPALLLLLLLLPAFVEQATVEPLDVELERLLARLHGEDLGERDMTLAMSGLKRLAETEGGPGARALFTLAALSSTGIVAPEVVPWDEDWAAEAMQRAAKAGATQATLAVAERLLRVEGNCDAALQSLSQVAQTFHEGHSVPGEPVRLRDRLRDGAWQDSRSQDQESLLQHQEMAARGSASATQEIGYRRLGKGLDADPLAAGADFERAARAGDEVGMYNLGYWLLTVRQSDFSLADEMFRKAAAKGVAAAHTGLGIMAQNGHGRVANLSAAIEHFEKGAAMGDKDALFNLGSYEYDGNPQAALRHYEAAVDAGHWIAPHYLAGMYANGLGTPKDCSRAAELWGLFLEERLGWAHAVDDAIAKLDRGDAFGALVEFALLSAQGCEVAASNAAFVLWTAGSVRSPWLSREQSLDRAAALLATAAARGGVEAHVDLGDLALARGQPQEAARHYAAGAAVGSSEAQFDLALMYVRGAGELARNHTRARELLLQAWDTAPFDEALVAPALLLAALRAWALLSWATSVLELDLLMLLLASLLLLHVLLKLCRRRNAPV